MAQPHIHSGESILLAPLGPMLAGQHTHALLKARQLEMVHLVLQAGRQMPMHAAPGEITLFGIEGEMDLHFDGRTVPLSPGRFIHLAAGVPHAVEARTDASALLTICLVRSDGTAIPATPVPINQPTQQGESYEHHPQT